MKTEHIKTLEGLGIRTEITAGSYFNTNVVKPLDELLMLLRELPLPEPPKEPK